ncbi:hypothetical protein ACJMK2_008215 [Sinanodonta woodiana]|uniref:Jacalin-type lectin domain-containing protein n=1 Tax=Sinanodonta woodiana TaxID=1069815 RepID=A0ABD3VKU9_SINWO
MYIKGTEGDVNPTVSCISIPVYGGLAQQDATTLGFSLYGGFPGSKIQLMNEMLTFIPTSGINQAVSPVTPGVPGLASPTPTPTPTPTALSPSASNYFPWIFTINSYSIIAYTNYISYIIKVMPVVDPKYMFTVMRLISLPDPNIILFKLYDSIIILLGYSERSSGLKHSPLRIDAISPLSWFESHKRKEGDKSLPVASRGR